MWPHSHSPVCFSSQLAGLIWFFASLGDSSIKSLDAWHALISRQNIKKSQLLQFYQWKGLWEIKICFSVSNLKNITAVLLIGETVLKKDIFLRCIVHPLSLPLFVSSKKCSKWAGMNGEGTELMAVSTVLMLAHLATPWLPFLLVNILKLMHVVTVPLWHFLSITVCVGLTGMKSLGGSKFPKFYAL